MVKDSAQLPLMLPPPKGSPDPKDRREGNVGKKKKTSGSSKTQTTTKKKEGSAVKCSVSAKAKPSDLKLMIPSTVLSDFAAMQLKAGRNEIGGIGIVEKVDDEIFTLVKLYVATSSHSGSLNVMDAAEVGDALFRAAEQGHINREEVLFWHTHPGLGLFWSATDTNAIEEQIIDGGRVINLLFDGPSKSTARLDYLENYEEFKATRETEMKALIKKHQSEAKQEALEKAQRALVAAKHYSQIRGIADVPSYAEIVRVLAELKGKSADSYYIRERAIHVQQHLLTLARYNTLNPPDTIEDLPDEVDVSKLEYKIKPIKASEFSVTPEVVSLEMEVVLDSSYLEQELAVLSKTGSTRSSSYSSGYQGGYGGYGRGYNDLYDDYYNRGGYNRSSSSSKSSKKIEYYEDTLKDKDKDAKSTKKDEDPYDIAPPDPTEDGVVVCEFRAWQAKADVPEVKSSTMVEPAVLPGEPKGSFVRTFKLPVTLLDYNVVSCLDDFVLWFLGQEAQRNSDYFLDIVTDPVIAYTYKGEASPIETLGEWLFGPEGVQVTDAFSALEVFLTVDSMNLRYPSDTPIEGIALLDFAVQMFFEHFDEGMFMLTEILEYVITYFDYEQAYTYLEQLNAVAMMYDLRYITGQPVDCKDYLDLDQQGLITEAVEDLVLDAEVLSGRRDIFLDPEFAEAQRVIATLED